jgi:hypothetical protein
VDVGREIDRAGFIELLIDAVRVVGAPDALEGLAR